MTGSKSVDYGSTGKFFGLGPGTLSAVATMVAVSVIPPVNVSLRPPALIVAQLHLP
jgi:hypothetical protein